MSGKQGWCSRCKKWDEGMYSIDLERGWVDDKYELHEELCEKCVKALMEFMSFKEYPK